MRINVSLPNDIFHQLQLTIPQGRRSKFIAKALSDKLKGNAELQNKLIMSLKLNHDFYEKEAKVWQALESEKWPE